jgi:hypothetical protein
MNNSETDISSQNPNLLDEQPLPALDIPLFFVPITASLNPTSDGENQ